MDQELAAKETATVSARSDQCAKILIAEDSPVQAELLRRALEGAGYQVIVACDGAEGLALAKAHHPAAVVSDINMPIMDGYAMCQAIRREESLKSTPVILLTMLSDPEDVIHGLNAGADAYLTKPYNIPSLLARLAALLAYPPVPPPAAEQGKVEVRMAGQARLVNAYGPRMLSLLISTYENAVLQTRELAATQQALEEINQHLEQKVHEKTAALQDSEEKFRSIAASAQDAIIIMDDEGKIALWNSAAETIFGYCAEDVLGRDLHALLAPARYHDDYRKGFDHFRSTGEGPVVGTTLELTAARKGGEEFPIELSLSAVKLANKWHAIGILRDITERKRIEETRRAAALYARNLIEASLDPLVTISPEGKITDVNRMTEEVTGVDRTVLIGTDFADYFTEPEQARSGYRQVLSQGEVRDYPLTIRHRNGHSTDVLYNATVYRNEAGEVQGVFAAARDITERKRTEEALRKSEKDLREAQRVAQIGSWDWDATTDTITWSEEYYHIYGLDPAQRPPGYKDHLKAYTPESAARLDAAVKSSMQTGESYELDLELARTEGARRWITARSETRRDAQGQIIGLRGTAQNVTERKRGELALERANRALRTLSACNVALVHAGNESELLDSICRLIVETGGYRMAWVGFREDDAANTIRPVAQFGQAEGYLAASHFSWADNDLGRGPTGMAIRTGSVQINRDFLTDPALAPWRQAALKCGFQSSIALPLRNAAGTLGVLTIDAAEPNAFDEAEVKLLQELAGDLAFGIETLRTRVDRDRIAEEHQQHAEILRQSLEDSIKAVANTLEMRDPYTGGHQRRVGELAAAISRELGLSEDTIHGIALAASIHDLGKISVPAEILSKPGKLLDIEFLLIKTHAQAGHDIVKDIKFPWPIATIVLQHHERLDGSGYPKGLKGDQIILESHIMAVADVIEAMASHRPYRAALGIDVALKEIARGRNTIYDAAVVDACMKLFAEKRFAFST